MLRGGEWGYERLQLLARVRRADTLELLRRAGLRPGMRCLDLGCGGGEEAAAAIADLTAFAADPETVIASPRTFQLWARRPDA